MADTAGDRALAASGQLSKIGFVEYSTHLITDVYRTIVEASIEQLKAYADFVETVAKTLEEYQDEVIGGDANATADNYIQQTLSLRTTDDPVSLTADQAEALRQHFAGITIPDTEGKEQTIDVFIDNTDPNNPKIPLGDLRKFVIAKLKVHAEESYNLIKTILKIGMQKVVVTNGDILTKLTFHVDASDTYSKNTQNIRAKSTSWGIQGSVTGQYGGQSQTRKKHAGGLATSTVGGLIGGGISGNYASSKLSVSIVNETHTAATNVTVDIMGQVRVQFRTETFPTVES